MKLGAGPRPRSVVVLGGGAAGHAAAEMLRRRGFEGDVTIVSADEAPPVDRPNLSKDYLAGNAPEEWVPLRPPEAYDAQRIALRLGARVDAIDPAKRTLSLAGGGVLPWDALILATGATPRRLAIPGGDAPHVHVLRTLADCRAIIDAAKSAKRACVVGASFIGLEVAAALRTRGLEVDVVAPEPKPLARIVGDTIGALVQRIHEEHGVRFHLGRTPARIDGRRVVLDSGATLDADFVVAGVGVAPSFELAERAGLAVDRGVVVNERLETSVPGIWAAGDVARWPDPRGAAPIRVEHWVVAQRMGQIAARNVLGARERCDLVPFFWSQHYDVPIAYVGHAERFDRVEIVGDVDARDFAAILYEANAPRAVITAGRDRASLHAEAAMDAGDFARAVEAARA